MISPAKRQRLKVLAQLQVATKTDNFGGYNKDASAYQLQLKELTNDKLFLKGIQSIQTKIEEKCKLMPKYIPYIEGVLKADQPVNDLVVSTLMTWSIDTGYFSLALDIAEFVLKHKLQTPDNFSRPPASVVAENIANAALSALKSEDGSFDIDILKRTNLLTASFDMHDQIRAKLYHAIGKLLLKMQQSQEAITFLKLALDKNPAIKAKADLKSAEKLAKEQAEQSTQPERQEATPLLNLNGTPVVDDHGNMVPAS